MKPADHAHADFALTDDETDPLGRPVDATLLDQYVAAAYDSCTSCQDALLTLLVDDAVTTARLVELACIAVHNALDGLPASMTDENAPGLASREFRLLARAGLDGANTTMFDQCAHMSTPQRRDAANTATDLLIGHLG